MSNIDDGIVSMQFDNESFERKLGATLTSLDNLTKALQFSGAQAGFADISSAADDVDFSAMASGIDNISSKFNALGAVAFAVIQNITSEAINFAKNTADKVIDPLLTGGKSRATNIEQAKFMFRGLGIDVDAGMTSALDAVRGTAFGLDEAAKAAAQFGASGIKVGDEMTASLRGVAGAAAMTGSSFTEIADIFAGSAGSGKVTNQDLLQFATRGLNAAAAIAPILGKTEQQVHEMATNGELDFKKFAGAMDEAFGKHATEANQTYTGALANLHAALSRVGASFFTPRLEQQRDLFNALSPVIDKLNKALQPVIMHILQLTGEGTQGLINFVNALNFDNITTAFGNIGVAIGNLREGFVNLKSFVGGAFREVFPKSDTSFIVTFTEGIKNFTERFKEVGPTIVKIADIFGAFFSIIKIGWTVVKELFSLFKDLFGNLSGIGSGVFDLADSFAVAVINARQFLVEGGAIHDFFLKLREAIKGPVEFIKDLIGVLGLAKDKIIDFFTGVSETSGENRIGTRIGEMKDAAQSVSDAWDRLTDRLQGVFAVFDKVWDYIKNWFGSLGEKLAEAFKPGDFDHALDILNVGLLGGIAIMLQKFLAPGGIKLDLSGGLLTKIKGMFNGVTETLSAMQIQLKADALKKIAEALALLTLSIVVLSFIDSEKLTKALVAITVGFLQLTGVMVLMDKAIDSERDAAKIGILGAAMLLLSGAMVILSVAITRLSKLDWNELTKGLIGVGVGLALLVEGTKLITTDVSGLIRAGIAMLAISAGLVVLSASVRSFATLSWEDLGKGLLGAAAGLAAMTLAMKFMPPSSVLSGLGFIEIATGLNILAGAVKLFSLLSPKEIGTGLGAISLGLLAIAGVMKLMPLDLPITAAGMIILSTALVTMAGAVKLMGMMDIDTLAKGVGSIAAMLLILATGMILMEDALPGALALVVVSGALTVLTSVLQELGKLSIAQIVTSIATIAAVIGGLGLAAVLMLPIIPELLLLGVALGVVGAAFALFGAGAYLVATAFEKLAEAGDKGTSALKAALETLITALPDLGTALAKSIINAASELGSAIPLLTRILGALLLQLLQTIIDLAPKLGEAILVLVHEFLKVVREAAPDIIQTGYELLIDFLSGIRDNIGEITALVADIVTNFLDALREKVPKIVDSVVELMKVIIVEVVRKTVATIPSLTVEIGIAIIEGLIEGLTEAGEKLFEFIVALPGKLLKMVKAGLGIDSPSTKFMEIGVNIILGLLEGLIGIVGNVATWFIELPGKIVGWVGDVVGTLKDKGIDLITGFISGYIEKVKDVFSFFFGLPGLIIGWIGDVGGKLKDKGIDLIVGFIKGIGEKAVDVVKFFVSLPKLIVDWIGDIGGILYDVGKNAVVGFINGIVDYIPGAAAAGKALGGSASDAIRAQQEQKSPSKLMYRIGAFSAKGFILGLSSMIKSVEITSKRLGDGATNNFKPVFNSDVMLTSMTKLLNNIDGIDNFSPTITPVLDLTKVQSEAKNLDKLFRMSTLTPDVSLQNARVISTTSENNRAEATSPIETGPHIVTFEQNNYSPKALSANDIYNKTKSQIALAKEELGIAS